MTQAIGRYASTLFELASESKTVDAIENDANALIMAFDASPELVNVLKSPLIAATEKFGVLSAIAKKLKVSETVSNFIGVVVNNSRAGELPSMFKGFLDKAAAAKGLVKAEIASANALSDAQIEELKSSLSSAFKSDVEIETKVNPELIGGLVVKVGSRLFDDSIKTKLEALKNNLKGA